MHYIIVSLARSLAHFVFETKNRKDRQKVFEWPLVEPCMILEVDLESYYLSDKR